MVCIARRTEVTQQQVEQASPLHLLDEGDAGLTVSVSP